MTITYSCVANGRAVLAELALTGGSYQVPAGRASAPEGSAPRGGRPGLTLGRGVTSEAAGVGRLRPLQALWLVGGSRACAAQGLGLVLHAGVRRGCRAGFPAC